MKRKLFSLLLCIALIAGLVLTANASVLGAQIIDIADLFSDQEQIELESKADSLMERYGMDIVILTIDSLDGKSPQDYADDFYDNNGYGDDGLLFLLSMEERDWYISTCGDAIYAVTDYGAQQLGNVALPYLSDGEYYEAFDAYLDELPYYFDALESGKPIDGYADYSGDYYHGDQEQVVYYEDEGSFDIGNVIISLFFALIVSGITILIMRISMNTRRRQRSAGNYLKSDSYDLHTKQDIFLYSRVSKVRRQQNNNNSSGGGSSIHRSSSGRSHGGGGGKF